MVALIATGVLVLVARRSPGPLDAIFPIALVPTVCIGIAFSASGQGGLAYLTVLAAPLAGVAVLFERPVGWSAFGVALVTCFVALRSPVVRVREGTIRHLMAGRSGP